MPPTSPILPTDPLPRHGAEVQEVRAPADLTLERKAAQVLDLIQLAAAHDEGMNPDKYVRPEDIHRPPVALSAVSDLFHVSDLASMPGIDRTRADVITAVRNYYRLRSADGHRLTFEEVRIAPSVDLDPDPVVIKEYHRPVHAALFETILELARARYVTLDPAHPEQERDGIIALTPDELAHYLELPGMRLFVAEHGDRVLGFYLAYYDADSLPSPAIKAVEALQARQPQLLRQGRSEDLGACGYACLAAVSEAAKPLEQAQGIHVFTALTQLAVQHATSAGLDHLVGRVRVYPNRNGRGLGAAIKLDWNLTSATVSQKARASESEEPEIDRTLVVITRRIPKPPGSPLKEVA